MRTILIFILALSFGCSSNEGSKVSVEKENKEAVINFSNLEFDSFGEIIPPEIIVGEASNVSPVKNLSLILLNPSNDSVPLSIEVDGENFSLKVNRCGEVLLPKKSCRIEVSFSARNLFSGENYTAMLKLNESVQVVLKSSVVGKPDPSSSGDAILSSSMEEGFEEETGRAYRTVNYKNIGTRTIIGLSFSPTSNYEIRVNRCPQTLSPNKECFVQVLFREYRNQDPVSGFLVASSASPNFEAKQTNLLSGESIVFNPSYTPGFSENFPVNTKTEICSGSETAYKDLISCRNQFNESVALSFCNSFPRPEQINRSPLGERSRVAITGGERVEFCNEGSSVVNSFVECQTPDYFENQGTLSCDSEIFVGSYQTPVNPVPNSCDGTQSVISSLIGGSCEGTLANQSVSDNYCSATNETTFRSPPGNKVESITGGSKTLFCNEGNNFASSLTSFTCIGGRYFTPNDISGTCETCSAGTFAPANSTSCSNCGTGTYQPSVGQTSCLNCTNKPTNAASATYSGSGGITNTCPYSDITCNSGWSKSPTLTCEKTIPTGVWYYNANVNWGAGTASNAGFWIPPTTERTARVMTGITTPVQLKIYVSNNYVRNSSGSIGCPQISTTTLTGAYISGTTETSSDTNRRTCIATFDVTSSTAFFVRFTAPVCNCRSSQGGPAQCDYSMSMTIVYNGVQTAIQNQGIVGSVYRASCL